MYSIEFTKQADKALDKMPRNTRLLVVEKIKQLARDPFGAANVKQLVGRPGCRLRVGDWRVIYDVESRRLVVRVLKFGSRAEVYE